MEEAARSRLFVKKCRAKIDDSSQYDRKTLLTKPVMLETRSVVGRIFRKNAARGVCWIVHETQRRGR